MITERKIYILESEIPNSCWLREIEMTIGHAGLHAIQFMRDMNLFGIRGAISYVKRYEAEGHFEEGTTAELERIATELEGHLSQ
jgi:hypothetical protein